MLKFYFSLLLLCLSFGHLMAEDQSLDLDFTNAPVTAVLQTIAQLANKNIVIGEAVSGQMSLHVTHMNWPQALQQVLQSQGLSLKEANNTWYIDKTAILLNQTRANSPSPQALPAVPIAASLETVLIKIHYARARELQEEILQDKDLLSAQGQLIVDPRTGTFIVTDTPQHVAQIKMVIAHLDVPVQQIHIEARIVVVDKSALQSFGIVLDDSATGALNALGSVNQASIQLPIANPAGTIGFGLGHLAGNALNLQLEALEASGDGKVISAPELTVSNHQEAYIEQGSEIPFQTSTSSGATQVEFKKAVLGLRVIPQWTQGQQINLILQVNKDSISHQTGAAGDLPIINTSQVNTNVLVHTGETIVLGGIYGEEKVHALNQIPVLGGIPGIGWLFRSTHDSEKYTDLLIFVTPTLVHS